MQHITTVASLIITPSWSLPSAAVMQTYDTKYRPEPTLAKNFKNAMHDDSYYGNEKADSRLKAVQADGGEYFVPGDVVHGLFLSADKLGISNNCVFWNGASVSSQCSTSTDTSVISYYIKFGGLSLLFDLDDGSIRLVR